MALNLGGLLGVGSGNGQQQTGLLGVTIPGIIDVTVLPSSPPAMDPGPGAGSASDPLAGLTGGLGLDGLLGGGLAGGLTGGLTDTLGGVVGGVTGGLTDTLGGVVDPLLGTVGGIADPFTDVVGEVLQPVTGTVGDLLSGTGALSGLLGGVGGGVGDLLSGLGSATGDVGKGLGDLLGNLGNGANGPGIVIIDIDGGTKITGTPSNDFLQGSAGNDYLYGGAGDDILDGMGGFDVGVYQGNHTDYTVTAAGGVVTVKDAVATRDGTDTLRNKEFLQFKDGGVDLATGTFVAQDVLDATKTGYRGVVREDAPGGLTETVGVGIAQGKFTFDQYVDALVAGAKTSTVPALLVASLVSGTIPTSEKLDSLTEFAKVQFDYYKNVLGSAFSELGPYEALGRGFASTAEFRSEYAAGSDGDFISKAYADVFGSGPTTAQKASLQAQVDYFEGLYVGAGISAPQASIEARGAVYGQIVGYAANDAGEPLFGKADVLLTGFAAGDQSQYGMAFAA